jgi:hypothetical protein
LELALVRVELLLKLRLGLGLCSLPRLMNGKLRIAELAHADDWNIFSALDDPKFTH